MISNIEIVFFLNYKIGNHVFETLAFEEYNLISISAKEQKLNHQKSKK